jgi:hypothetical protein
MASILKGLEQHAIVEVPIMGVLHFEIKASLLNPPHTHPVYSRIIGQAPQMKVLSSD